MNIILMAVEVFVVGGNAAALTSVARFVISANALGIIDWAWLKGLRNPEAHLSNFGFRIQDVLLACWAMWYLRCFGLCGVVSAVVGPAYLPMGVWIMGVEKVGFVTLFVGELMHAADHCGREGCQVNMWHCGICSSMTPFPVLPCPRTVRGWQLVFSPALPRPPDN